MSGRSWWNPKLFEGLEILNESNKELKVTIEEV
jgi:hypothetical protein